MCARTRIGSALGVFSFIFNPSLTYGRIPSGGTAASVNDFEVGSNAPDGHTI
jgi:hypothetical protein